jgi:hypothetical protein
VRVDPAKLLVLGHSRGAIATQAIAGADPQLARRWAGTVAASHYDGAEQWPCECLHPHTGLLWPRPPHIRGLSDVRRRERQQQLLTPAVLGSH